MKKLTRRSYNRKLIMLGLSLFLSVGLITTGFSAWLISSVKDATATPPVTAGAISADSVVVTIDQWTPNQDDPSTGTWTGDNLRFDAAAGDNTGRVTLSAEGDLVEKLTMVISGSVTNYAKLAASNGLVMTIQLPDSIAAALAAGYIELDNVDGATTDNDAATYNVNNKTITVALATTPKNDPSTDATFTYTLTFAWGAYFGDMNPSLFYDSDTAQVNRGLENTAIKGNAIPDAQVTAEMKEFHRILTGRETTSEDLDAAYSGTIAITVTPTLG